MEMDLFFYFSSPKESFWAILKVALKNNKLKIHDEKWKPMITFL